MRAVFDGTKSLLAAIAAVLICGLPAWFTFASVQDGLAPSWAYVPAGALAIVGILLTVAFLGKAFRGVSPSRDRRRR